MHFLRFFESKKSFITSGLLNGTTDIHSHLLSGIDDGVNDYSEAVQILRWLRSHGVGRVYLTPHVMSDYSKNTAGYLLEQFGLLIKYLENEGVTDIPDIKLGAEYMLEATFKKHKEDGLLTYADRHLLVEMSYMMPPLGYRDMLEDLLESGYSPILAHPERYLYMEMKDFVLLKEQGIKLQLNFISLIGAYGPAVQERAEKLLIEGFYDYTGSDIHHLSRHKEILKVQKLTKKQIIKLHPLFHNNQKLW